jgi:hypothetical protein
VVGEKAGELPMQVDLTVLLGLRYLGTKLLLQVAVSVAAALLVFFLLLGLRALLRKQWLAAVVFVVLMLIPRLLSSSAVPVDLAFGVVALSIDVIILFRFGLVTYVAAVYVVNVLVQFPLTLDFSSWYIGDSIFVLVALAALAAWAFRTALAGRSVFLSD